MTAKLISFKFDVDEAKTKCNENPSSEDDKTQQCKLSYLYKPLRLVRANLINTNQIYTMVKFKVSIEHPETRVVFNRARYTPTTIYLINPGRIGQQGKFKIENMFPMLRVKDDDGKKNEMYGKEDLSGNQQLIIAHELTHSDAKTDYLWLVIPIELVVPKTPKENVSAGSRPSEIALRLMVEEWVDGVKKSGRPTPSDATGNDDGGLGQRMLHVDLNEVIPVKGNYPNQPYVYIKYSDVEKRNVTHHILYFKPKHSMQRYWLGNIDEYVDQKENAIKKINDVNEADVDTYGHTGLNDRTDKRTASISVFDSDGKAPLLKNLSKHVPTRRKVNMKCRPVQIGGEKYEPQYDLVRDSSEENVDKKIDNAWSKNRFFGFSFVVLVLMILLVPVAIHYLVKART